MHRSEPQEYEPLAQHRLNTIKMNAIYYYESLNILCQQQTYTQHERYFSLMGEKPNLQSAFISSLQPHSTSRSRRSSINFSFSPLSTNFMTNQSPPHCYHTQGTNSRDRSKTNCFLFVLTIPEPPLSLQPNPNQIQRRLPTWTTRQKLQTPACEH